MIVHKFGGSSLATAEKIANIVNIISCKDQAIVVSASAKTTMNLQKAIDQAVIGDDYNQTLDLIFNHHNKIIEELIPDDKFLNPLIVENLDSLKNILSTISITNFCAGGLRAFILGFGEIWSAQILTAYLKSKGKDAHFIDASECLVIDDNSSPIRINWQVSLEKLEFIEQQNPADVYVITGFIAQNKNAKRTILGLNCSDYSAAIFTKLLQASKLYIWTDVAGVYSANPQVVPEAKPIAQLTYKEVLELSYFGASVVHPLTIAPMALENTPIYIKSSYAPDQNGTKISAQKDKKQGLIKGLTSISKVAIIRVQGAAMIGVSGIAVKVFRALDEAKISVMMISQASSEYSICFAINSLEADKARYVLKDEFKQEIKSNLVEEIIVEKHYSLITAVGEGIISMTGSLAKLVNSLKLANINIHAIAQGSSERSVTFAVKSADESRGVRAMHYYCGNASNDITIAVVGLGNIGKAFIKQIRQTYKKWYAKGINLVLIAVSNSKKMRITHDNLLFENIDNLMLADTQQVDLEELAAFMFHKSASEKILIDATASQDVAKSYLSFFKKGINVVTPNKYANSESYKFYQELRKVANLSATSFLYETNVCAGLPIIKTLQNMIQSGDNIRYIKGIFSGTLSYLFTQLNKGMLFSDAVEIAYKSGYMEPDPRQDLSGMDVARKTVILAREIGLNISLSDLVIENLLPEELRDCSVAEFFKKLPSFNDQIMKQIEAKKNGSAGVHYIGMIENDDASVGIQPYDKDSPFANVKGTDNMVIISTSRYVQPMIIQGAGAGVEVTAAGIYADLIILIREKT